MSRYLVTGAFGAIGVWTIRSLLDRGHEVVTFDLAEQAPRMAIALTPEEIERVVRVRADITDLNVVERALDEHGVTHVIHLAALQVPFVRADPPLGARVDVVGTVNVFEAVRRRRGRIAPLVYASSIAALGDDEHPSTLYGIFKRANEGTGVRYFEDYGVSSIGIRPHTVYGPARDQGLTSAPTTAMIAAAAGVRYHIPFGGSVQMQYTADVGEAFVRATELDAYEGASVHNLDGPVVSMPDLLGMLGSDLITCAEDAAAVPARRRRVVVRGADRRLGHAPDRRGRGRVAGAVPGAAGRRARQGAHGTPRRRVSTCRGAPAATASSTTRPGHSVLPRKRSQWYGTRIVAPISVASATASRGPMFPTSSSRSRKYSRPLTGSSATSTSSGASAETSVSVTIVSPAW